ncbi:MAG: hypothetical protein NC916_03305 [Candidatus Omnitrophica bacterium]|nr:hypothetical protein [Candidatus Omnitrophota bacterium]
MLKKGQTFLEYTMIILTVAVALMVMTLYIKRAINANLLLMQNQINAEAVR